MRTRTQTRKCTRMLIAALFTLVKKWKQSNCTPTMNGQIIGGACLKWDNKKLENIMRIICHLLEQQQQKIIQYLGPNTAQIQNLT